MKFLKKTLAVIILSLHFSSSFTQSFKLPAKQPEVLTPKFELEYWGKLEFSGIVRSKTNNNVFWVHNDSGDQPRIFALDSTGHFYQSNRYKNYEGITVAGATNVDWEDITVDDRGNVIIADVGNNGNDRRDLVLYLVPEPSPIASNTTYIKRIFLNYPDQKEFPDKHDLNYDCEAIFSADDHIYFLSKNRSDSNTKLYRLDQQKSEESNPLTLIDTFNINGQVTAADASPDGNKIVVITYSAIWVFERTSHNASYFKGAIWWLPVSAPQIESVCFKDSKTIWLLDEMTAALYEVPISKLIKIR